MAKRPAIEHCDKTHSVSLGQRAAQTHAAARFGGAADQLALGFPSQWYKSVRATAAYHHSITWTCYRLALTVIIDMLKSSPGTVRMSKIR